MSSFSELLGNFQKSAQTLSSSSSSSSSKFSTDTKSPSNNNENGKQDRSVQDKKRKPSSSLASSSSSSWKSQKRKRSYNHDDSALPYDVKDLRVTISFLCIGAQKAGTTWLHEMLKEHPKFSLPTQQKELHFWDWNRRKGLGWYSRQFTSDCHSNLKSPLTHGEITPCYAVLPLRDIAEIHALFPKCKIIFIARPLVDRAWSALLMELRNNVRGMDRGKFASSSSSSLDDKKLLQKAHPDKYKDDYFMERIQHSTHSSRSHYAQCIQNWLTFFPKEQILILPYTQLCQQPRSTLTQISNFIFTDNDHHHDTFYSTVLSESKLHLKFNDAASSFNKNNHVQKKDNDSFSTNQHNHKSHDASMTTLRPSLRQKLQQYLKPYTEEFNELLTELGYEWKLDG